MANRRKRCRDQAGGQPPPPRRPRWPSAPGSVAVCGGLGASTAARCSDPLAPAAAGCLDGPWRRPISRKPDRPGVAVSMGMGGISPRVRSWAGCLDDVRVLPPARAFVAEDGCRSRKRGRARPGRGIRRGGGGRVCWIDQQMAARLQNAQRGGQGCCAAAADARHHLAMTRCSGPGTGEWPFLLSAAELRTVMGRRHFQAGPLARASIRHGDRAPVPQPKTPAEQVARAGCRRQQWIAAGLFHRVRPAGENFYSAMC